MCVHIGHTSDSVFLPKMDELVELNFFRNIDFGEMFYIRPGFVLSDLEVRFPNIQKVSDFFHIYLED